MRGELTFGMPRRSGRPEPGQKAFQASMSHIFHLDVPAAGQSFHSPHPRPEIWALPCLRSQKRSEGTQMSGRGQGLGTDLHRQLARWAGMHGNDAFRQDAAKPASQAVADPSAQARSGHRNAGNRTDRTDTVHHRTGARYRHAAPVHCRVEQGRGAPRAGERPVDRSSGRDPGPDHGKPAFPSGLHESACGAHHALEHGPARQSRHAAQAGGPGHARTPAQAHLTVRMGTHSAGRTVHLAQNER